MPGPIEDFPVLLEQLHLLDAAQLRTVRDELRPRHPDAKELARGLVRRGWLTPFQVNQIFTGKGHELLVGSYVLIDRLGQGGMGEVYKARNWKLGRIVALKIILKSRLNNPDVVRRFEREVRAAAALSHPNIVHALDADFAGGVPFLVLEYVDGKDLGSLIKTNGPMSVEMACRCVVEAARAMQHAHERGFVHRDIKPANLLLTTQNGQPCVKLLDLGLALLGGEAGEDTSLLTAEGSVMGTPDFMAPEQAIDAHKVDIRADIYSLGATLYFLVSGKVPFPGGSLGQKIARLQSQEPPPIATLRPNLPPGLAALVARAMAKDPAKRHATPRVLADALEPFANGVSDESVTSLSPFAGLDANQSAASPPTRSRLPVFIGGMLALAVVLLALFLLLRPAPEPTRPGEDLPALRRWVIDNRESPEVIVEGVLKAGPAAAVLLPETPLNLPREVVAMYGGHSGILGAKSADVAWRDDGIVVTVDWIGHLRHWDASNLRLLRTVPFPGDVNLYSIVDPSGKLILSPLKSIRLFNANNYLDHNRPELNLPTEALAISADGKLAAGAGGNSLVVRDTTTGDSVPLPALPAGKFSSLAFSPDRKKLVGGTNSGACHVANLVGDPTVVTLDYPKRASSLAIDPTCTRVAVGSLVGGWQVFDLTTGLRICQAPPQTTCVTSLLFTAEGKCLLVGEPGGLRLYSLPSGTLLGQYEGIQGQPAGLSRSPIVDEAVVLLSTQILVRVDTSGKSFTPLAVSVPNFKAIETPTRIAFSTSGKLMWGTDRGAVYSASGTAQGPVRTLLPEDGLNMILGVGFTPDERSLWAVRQKDSFRHWLSDGTGGGSLGPVVYRLLQNPEGTILFTRDPEVMFRRLEYAEGRWRGPDPVPGLTGRDVSHGYLSPTADWMVAETSEARLAVWSLGTDPRETAEIRPWGPHAFTKGMFGIASDQRMILQGAASVLAYPRGATGEVGPKANQPTPGLVAMRMSALSVPTNAPNLVVGDAYGRVMLYRTDRTELTQRWQLPGKVMCLGCNADASLIGVGCANGAVYVLRVTRRS